MTTPEQVGEARLMIDGELRGSSSGAMFENVNPATEEVIGVVADATAADMDDAIAAARRAFDAEVWSTDLDLRLRCLRQLQTALEEEKEHLRAELIAEVGAPIALTYGPQLDAPLADSLVWPTERAADYPWERRIADGRAFGRSKRIVTKVPVGVVGAIAPWNYPFEIALGKLGAALATGNTLILKPAPDTPWNATRIGRLIAERTDIPAGVVNVIASSDHARGEQLVTDPRVDMISFTGSTATGRRIMAQGAPSLKRLFLELGGKSAQIYLDDADLEGALAIAAFSVCAHGGQGCAMPTRMLLPRSRYDEGLEIVMQAFRDLKYGDPNDFDNLQGPQISRVQRDKILAMIERGVAEGARLVVGGGRPAHLEKGWYVEPTVFADVDNSMSIAREEIFGPVLSVIPFDDDEDAVRIANDSDYGLSGMVTAGDLDRALAVASRIRSGTMSVNGGQWYGAE
ncbi:MAG: aldehyde dehydrogenase family protein, partial [Nocardioides sp.]